MKRGEYWRIERATRAAVIVDAEDYFRLARAAMLRARKRIMLIGWDFDPRITLVSKAEREPGEPATLGAFTTWLIARNPELEVHVLRWDLGAVKALFRGSTIVTLINWLRHRQLHMRLDRHHPTGASHHQKIVVVDDCFAFCGGIDMTGDRWDTRAHKDAEPGRRQPNGKPYGPWHDATTALEGPVAAALGDLARARWEGSGGGKLAPVAGMSDCWPDALVAQFEDVDVAIARTVGEMADCAMVGEIEAMFLAQIAAARHRLYIETQYFASRRVAEAIAARLDEAEGPEIVVILPRSSEGWLQAEAMDSARARLFAALHARDRHRRLRLYHPVTAQGTDIYVHAKILVADDRVLRVGSANFNNRSMRLDSECDVAIDASLPANAASRSAIALFRDELIAEHFGIAVECVTKAITATGSLIAAIESLRHRDGRTLHPYVLPALSGIETWLADNEVLDPEGAGAMFEPLRRRGLFRRLRRPPK